MRLKTIPICDGCETAIFDPNQGVTLCGQIRSLANNEPLAGPEDPEEPEAYHLACLWKKLAPKGVMAPSPSPSPPALTLVPSFGGPLVLSPAPSPAPSPVGPEGMLDPRAPLPPGFLHATGVDGHPTVVRMDPGPMNPGTLVLLLEASPLYAQYGPILCKYQRTQAKDSQGGGGLCVLEAPDGAPILAPDGGFMRVAMVPTAAVLAHG